MIYSRWYFILTVPTFGFCELGSADRALAAEDQGKTKKLVKSLKLL